MSHCTFKESSVFQSRSSILCKTCKLAIGKSCPFGREKFILSKKNTRKKTENNEPLFGYESFSDVGEIRVW